MTYTFAVFNTCGTMVAVCYTRTEALTVLCLNLRLNPLSDDGHEVVTYFMNQFRLITVTNMSRTGKINVQGCDVHFLLKE